MTTDKQALSPRDARSKAPPIEEGFFAGINGLQQWITVRGARSDNPVLLLVGGPGSALSAMAPFFAPWEQFFTLVQWDQPGAGATHAKRDNPPIGSLTIARLASDGEAVAELVSRRLCVGKLWIMGISGGSAVALTMVSGRPELFSGYVGCGQIVHWARQDALSYSLLCEQARAAADAEVLAELERMGPPPYRDSAMDARKSKYAGAMTAAERAAFAALEPATLAALTSPPLAASYLAKDVQLEEPRALSFKTYDKLRKDLVAFDAATLGSRFALPLFFLQGELDAFTVTSEVREFVSRIEAPRKEIITIAGGGHSCIFLRDEILAALRKHIGSVTCGRRQPL